MKTMALILVAGACAVGFQRSDPAPTAHDAAVEAYKYLATAIIANRKAEESVVQGILFHHYAMARRSLRAALEAGGGDRSATLESAAGQITNIANEGDKPVQAIRQRLLKAGHHHHSDAETEADYIFVDSGEKKQLLALAREISKMSRNASEEQINRALRDLTELFNEVMAPE
ncbi:MAG: hypothetical protein ACYSU7_17480 [Planctomycetota bacterium]|jgi:hypothetical protein